MPRCVWPTAATISSPPQYDLALLAPQLIGVAATEVVPGAGADRRRRIAERC